MTAKDFHYFAQPLLKENNISVLKNLNKCCQQLFLALPNPFEVGFDHTQADP